VGEAAEVIPRLVLTVAVVIAVAWLAGNAMQRFGQPRIIGELAATIALGPSLVGATLPGVTAFLFTPDIHHGVHELGRAGVVLFMLFIGLELKGRQLTDRPRIAAALTVASVTAPFALGVAVALPLVPTLGPSTGEAWECAVFVGIALSVTAFPVLAAILQETRLSIPWLRDLALTCAALTDVVSWSLLAVLAAETQGGSAAVIGLRLLGVVAVGFFALVLLRRALLRLFAPPGQSTSVLPVIAVALAFGLATATEQLGVTVVFGAFVAGVALRGQRLDERRALVLVHRLTRLVLLPVFFASVGLNVKLHGGGNSLALAEAGLVLLTAAVVGKIGGVSLAAHCSRLGWRNALGLGVLLNTKGLTEIVVISVGFDLGLISSSGLDVLLAVTLVTTAATAPLVQALGLAQRASEPRLELARARGLDET
jgi:Kef-type K+ transport system membrane component KefB